MLVLPGPDGLLVRPGTRRVQGGPGMGDERLSEKVVASVPESRPESMEVGFCLIAVHAGCTAGFDPEVVSISHAWNRSATAVVRKIGRYRLWITRYMPRHRPAPDCPRQR